MHKTLKFQFCDVTTILFFTVYIVTLAICRLQRALTVFKFLQVSFTPRQQHSTTKFFVKKASVVVIMAQQQDLNSACDC